MIESHYQPEQFKTEIVAWKETDVTRPQNTSVNLVTVRVFSEPCQSHVKQSKSCLQSVPKFSRQKRINDEILLQEMDGDLYEKYHFLRVDKKTTS